MKIFDRLKTIQLVIYIVLGLCAIILLFANRDFYHAAATELPIKLLCLILWAILVISLIGIFYDLSYSARTKRDYSELDYAIYSDPVSGLANRNSCDVYIDKYRDSILPDNFCCIMFELINLNAINRQRGHAAGNELIRDFSNILTTAIKVHTGDYFIGRNSGNQFLVFFENIDHAETLAMLTILEKTIIRHNASDPNKPIIFRYGVSNNVPEENIAIGELISKATYNMKEM